MIHKTIMILSIAAISAAAFDGQYKRYNELLDKHVCKGNVNYSALAKDSRLDQIDKNLSSLTKKQYDALRPNGKMAYLINVYNFYTLLLIKNNYPLKSIRDIKKPWDTEFVPLFGNKVSLNHVEHEILRKNFDEPRIHFAVNCASIGCPAIAAQAYTGSKLDMQLDAAAKAFLTDKTKNKVDGKKLKLSKIFQWYGGDFKKKHGSYKDYVIKTLGLEGKYKVTFLEYDWGLNDVKNCE